MKYGVTISNSDCTAGDGLGHRPVHQPAHHLAFFHALLFRAVVDQLRMRPDERQPAGDHSGQRLAGRDAARIVGAVRLHLLAMFGQDLAILGQGGIRRRALRKRADRDRDGAVPELVECRRELLDDRARGKYIVIGELGFRIDLEILIADIAPADERDRIVDDHQLVVHPVVEPRVAEHEFEGAKKRRMAAIRERVEDPDLDLRMRVQRHDLLIACDRFAIVDQHAHAHAAVGRAQHGVGQQLAGLVGAKNEVLKIEGSLGGIDHLHPGQEPVDAYRQHAKPGIPAVFARRVCKLPAEAGLLGMSERRGGGLGKIGARRKRRASAQECGDKDGGKKYVFHLE